MDQLTFQTIIDGGILVTLIFLGGVLIGKIQGVINSLNNINGTLNDLDKTVGGGDKPKDPPPNTTK